MRRSTLILSAVAFCLIAAPLSAEESVTKTTDPAGTWHWVQDYGQGPVENWLMFKMDDEKLAGNYRRGDLKFELENCKIDGDKLTFKLDLEHNNKPVSVTCNAKVDDDKLVGKSSVVFKGETTEYDIDAKRATRPVDVVGNWKLHIEAQNREYFPEVQVTLDDDKFKAKYVTTEIGTHEIKDLTLKDNQLKFSLSLEGDAGTLDLKYEGIPRGSKINGKVHYEAGSTSGSADFTGKREKPSEK